MLAETQKPDFLESELCRHCGGLPLGADTFINGAHPLCETMRPLEQFLDATDDPSIEDETHRYRKTVFVLLTMWARLPRGEQEKTSHFLRCELAPANKMYAEVFLSGETADDKAKQTLVFAAMRAAGLEVATSCVFTEADGFSGLSLDVHGTSTLRQHDFFWWLHDLIKPFGAHVEQAGYADPSPDAKRSMLRLITKPKSFEETHQ